MTDQAGQTAVQAESTPRIYVACLAAYNNGRLHGRWIDAACDPDEIRQDIRAMLTDSPEPGAEEFAIHDHEGFEGIELHEYTGIDEVAEIAEFVAEHGRLGAAVYNHVGGGLEEAGAAFDDYAGEFTSLGAFAEDLIGETVDIPDSIARYVDYDAMGRDMELNGDVFTVETGFEQVHVFWNR